MAELALVASIIQVADIGLRLSLRLYTFGETVASADRSILTISKDVSLTSSVLQELGNVFGSDSGQIRSDNATRTAKNVIRECSNVFQEMDDLLLKKAPHLRLGCTDKKARAEKMLERLQWPVIKGKIELLNCNLERMKSTLTLMLNVIIYAQLVSKKNEPPAVIAEQRHLIEILAQVKEERVKALQQAKRTLDFEQNFMVTPTSFERPHQAQGISDSISASSSSATLVTSKQEPKILLLLDEYTRLRKNLVREVHSEQYNIRSDARVRLEGRINLAHKSERRRLQRTTPTGTDVYNLHARTGTEKSAVSEGTSNISDRERDQSLQLVECHGSARSGPRSSRIPILSKFPEKGPSPNAMKDRPTLTLDVLQILKPVEKTHFGQSGQSRGCRFDSPTLSDMSLKGAMENSVIRGASYDTDKVLRWEAEEAKSSGREAEEEFTFVQKRHVEVNEIAREENATFNMNDVQLKSLPHRPAQLRLEADGRDVPVTEDQNPNIEGYHSDSDISTNPSIIQGPTAGMPAGNRDHWSYKPLPQSQVHDWSDSERPSTQDSLVDRTANGAKGPVTSKRRMKKAATVVTDVLTLGSLFGMGRASSPKREPDVIGTGVAHLHAMPPSLKNFSNDDLRILQSGDGRPDIPLYQPRISPTVKTSRATSSTDIDDELKCAALKAERKFQDSNDKRKIKGEHERKREGKGDRDQDTPASESRVQKAPVPLSCEICSKKFTRAYNLRAHLRTHPGERPSKCDVCSEAFTYDNDLLRHKRDVHIGAYARRLFQPESSLPFSGESCTRDRESDNVLIPPCEARPPSVTSKSQNEPTALHSKKIDVPAPSTTPRHFEKVQPQFRDLIANTPKKQKARKSAGEASFGAWDASDRASRNSGGVIHVEDDSENDDALGPVPLPRPPGGDTGRVTPPTEIMVRRKAREVRRREESERFERQQNEGESREDIRTSDVGFGRASRGGFSSMSAEDDLTDQPAPIQRRRGDLAGSVRAADVAGSQVHSEKRVSSVPEAQSNHVNQPRSRRRASTQQSTPVESGRIAHPLSSSSAYEQPASVYQITEKRSEEEGHLTKAEQAAWTSSINAAGNVVMWSGSKDRQTSMDQEIGSIADRLVTQWTTIEVPDVVSDPIEIAKLFQM